MMKHSLTRLSTLLLAAIVGLIVSSSAFGQATIIIENGDAAGVGFNDPTSVAQVGGNSGTTLGQQRLIAFQAAANIWGASISSTPSITIHATWEALPPCTASSGVLGSAGNSGNIYRNFSGSVPGFWYGNALANALSGFDRNGTSPEINARFNVNLGTTGCLETLHWYYGLDNNHGTNGVDLVTVLIHEFAHGLGFQTFTNSSTGTQAFGFPSIYDNFLFDNTAGKTWAQMTTDAERQASAVNTNKLVWNGPQVTSDVPVVLGTPRLRVNSPLGIAGNYTVGTATFGPALTSAGVTGNVAQASPNDGCSAIGGSVSGKIALIDRGTCFFVVKVKNAQDAGAVGVIIADNMSSSSPPGMAGTDPTITIPSVSITMADGNTIKAQLGSGVNATLLLDASVAAGADQFGHPLMFAPNPVVGGSSVSHWDTSEFPNQLMEPNINDDLTHSVTTPEDLTRSLLKDIGWPTGTPPPAPSPTPTPSPPPNDNFANAQVVNGCAGSAIGTNIAATKEAGEPNNPDSPTSTKSVWYQWQAPISSSVTIDTHGSDFDTVLAVYTGSSVNGLTLVLNGNNDDTVPGSDLTSTVTISVTQGTTYRIAVNGFDNAMDGGDTGNIKLNWAESGCTLPNTVRFSTTDYPIGEGQGAVVVSVVRTDSTGATTVDLRTADTDTFTVGCATKQGSAYGRCDFATVVTTVTIPAGQLSTNVLVPIIDDSWAEGSETFSVVLSNPTGATLGSPSTATVTITDNETVDGTNPILLSNDAGIAFFVRQHYLDFLGREPEPGEPWSAILRGCANQFNTDPNSPSAGCDRITVSGAFFGSPEFKDKGILDIDFYRVAFDRLPQYAEFAPDLASLTGATAAEANAKRAAFANNFVLRTEFVNTYGAMTNSTYVTTLMSHMGQYNLSSITTPDPANPDGTTKVTLTTSDLINRLDTSALTRAQVLRAIVQSDEVTLNLEAVNAFVASQYYGYLRRTPDTGGFNGWVTYLKNNPSDFRTMVNGFVNSIEYRLRFGPS
jgi:hypothetical protein